MGKRKPVSILKKNPGGSKLANGNVKKRHKSHQNAPPRGSHAPQNTTNEGMFPSSQLHRRAAYAVGRLLEADLTQRGGVSLKSLTLAPHIENKRAVYAVTVETLKHIPILEKIVKSSGLIPAVQLRAAYVLCRELLWGDGLQPDGPAERAVLKVEDKLRSDIERMMKKAGASEIEELLPATALAEAAAQRPRTARVNELKMTTDETVAWLLNPPAEHAEKWRHAGQNVRIDEHIPELLVFPPGTDLHDHPLVASGSLILQSKASCMTAKVLAPHPGCKALDACAAPGNKTTHLAALMKGKGTIIAFDKDPRRLQTLVENSERAGADAIIDPRCSDFLSIDPLSSEYADVDVVLLDPSCSGSGTSVSRMDYLLPSAANRATGEAAVAYRDARVEALAAFQTSALRHALKFPGARRIAYSTCSLHAAENEEVVAAVLEEARSVGYELESALPRWPRRGLEFQGGGKVKLSAEEASKLVRTDPLEDGTDGFFVALFERKKPGKTKKKSKSIDA